MNTSKKASDIFISQQMNQKLCFVVQWEAYFIQIKLRSYTCSWKCQESEKSNKCWGCHGHCSCPSPRWHAGAVDEPGRRADDAGEPAKTWCIFSSETKLSGTWKGRDGCLPKHSMCLAILNAWLIIPCLRGDTTGTRSLEIPPSLDTAIITMQQL